MVIALDDHVGLKAGGGTDLVKPAAGGIALGERNERFVFGLQQVQGFPAVEAVAGVEYQNRPVVIEYFVVPFSTVQVPEGGDNEIVFGRGHVLVEVVQLDGRVLYQNVGVGLKKFVDRTGPERLGRGGHGEAVVPAYAGVLEFRLGILQSVEDFIHIALENASVFIQADVAAHAVEELDAKFVFQSGDGGTQRGRGNHKAFGGAGQMFSLRQNFKII